MELSKTYDIVGLFFNPNIHPYKEYLDRKQSVLELSKEFHIRLLEDSYPYAEFLADVIQKPEEKDRCTICYQTRLKRLKEVAKTEDIELVSTSLLYSIYQKHDLILSLASEIFSANQFLPIDYRREFWQGVQEAKNRNFYRQKYCGCLFSNFERFHDQKK